MKIYIVKKAKDRRIEDSILTTSKIKEELCADPIAKKILDKFNMPEEVIQGLSISFDEDLDVTAKTVNGEVTLNKTLLDKSFHTLMRYVIHELVHVCQHIRDEDKKPKKSPKGKGYLENKEEIEAFKWQTLYETETKGEDKAEEYLENLLEFHKIPKKEREDKIEELKDYLE